MDPRQITFVKTSVGFDYYVADFAYGALVVYDQDFVFKTMLSIPSAFGVKAVDDIDVYVCAMSTNTLYKLDTALNIVITVTGLDSPKTIAYDKSSDWVYVNGNNMIYIYDRFLVQLDAITMSSYYLSGMNVYNGKVFLANIGSILIMENKVITATYTTICTAANAYIYSFYFISDQLMLIGCYYDNILRVLHHDTTPTGQTMPVTGPIHIEADPLGRLVVTRLSTGVIVLA